MKILIHFMVWLNSAMKLNSSFRIICYINPYLPGIGDSKFLVMKQDSIRIEKLKS
jgi:hypothetical protein